ncbi:hypothetical protein AGABI1DRAFT_111365 [Agaricus bisporus var. burnettii JB137-S8]|uniref:Uncharacterized protein n=2 Tax=Agaricus bisporus var. burnettii TaxID=192524 RepID=K5W7H0_AGABU|nr:uncharacterized protein AGABI1DRAFT_111365 [Agaricus bisporus var. burnettii JB137-S8]EKM82794.1 hypothetical protein AGABI1DRAFT_111365 [Agaricus bisporus var. burnettii JB137-S8]KAF7778828.1 hypothetical protein Agabi119p4_3173 [Agaricus bisporus var. burnettii]
MPSIQCRLWRIQNSADLALPPATHPNPDISSPDSQAHSGSSDYPFPPPGLSKPSPMPYSPLDFELTSDRPTTPSTPDSSDSSIWGAFQLDSFIENYNNNIKPASAPSFQPTHTKDPSPSPNSNLLPSSSMSPSICPAYLKKLKSLMSLESGNTTLARPVPRRPPPPPPVNPLMTLRLQQQNFMLKWNKFREKNPHAPAMPSYFNPSRSEAPRCAWTFLRYTGFVNQQTSARRAKDSVFERPLVKLPLTRCRSICDGTRRAQHYGGWGIHAWFAASKHCGACASDTLLKNFLAFRAFETARIQEAQQLREQYAMVMMDPSPSDDPQEAPDPDAVFLSFPYQRSADEPPHTDSFINYNGLDSSSNLSDDSEDWAEDVDKDFLTLQDLDDFDFDNLEDEEGLWHSDEEDDSDRYSDSSSSDTCDNDDISVSVCPTTVSASSELGSDQDKKKGKKLSGGIVLMTLRSEDDDNDDIECIEEAQSRNEEAEALANDLRVVEVQIQA